METAGPELPLPSVLVEDIAFQVYHLALGGQALLPLASPVEEIVLGRVVGRLAWGIRLLVRGLVAVLLAVEAGCAEYRVPLVAPLAEGIRLVSSV